MTTSVLLLLFVFTYLSDFVTSKSRYFVDEGLSEDRLVHFYPIDVCVGNPFNFIKYECNISNPNNHIVIKYNHTIDYPNCDSPNPIITYHTSDDINDTEYDLYDFNCIGEDNHFKLNFYFDDNECIDLKNGNLNVSELMIYYDYFPLYMVSHLCDHIGDSYHSYSCSGYFGKESIYYSLTDCNNYNSSFDLYYPSTHCSFEDVSVSECIENGTELTPYSYIAEIGTLPIKQRMSLVDIYFYTYMNAYNEISLYMYSLLCDLTWKSMEVWNLSQIWYEGNAFLSTNETVSEDVYEDPSRIFGLSGRKSFCFIHTEYLDGINDTNNTYLTVTYINLFNWKDGDDETTGIYASVPESISNLEDLKTLMITGSSQLDIFARPVTFSGSIPTSLWELSELEILHILGTELESKIPESICSTHLKELYLYENNFITGSLPNCMNDMLLEVFNLEKMSGLTGIIPENILCSPYLKTLRIDENYNLDQQEIPQCFSNPKTDLWELTIRDSSFTGTIPPIPINILSVELESFNETFDIISGPYSIDLSGNKYLEGTISDMFTQYIENHQSFVWLQFLYLQNGNFYDEDISIFLQNVFEAKSKTYIWGLWVPWDLGQISLANNDLYGSLPDMDITVNFQYHTEIYDFLGDTAVEDLYANEEFIEYLSKHSELESLGDVYATWDIASTFSIHNCKLSGTIPTGLKFRNLNMLTMQNNFFTGYIPSHFSDSAPYPPNPDRYYSMLLLGNNLWTDSNGLPVWVNSPYATAPNVYTSQQELNERTLILIMWPIGIVIMLSWIYIHYFKKLKIESTQNDNDDSDEYTIYFLNSLKSIQIAFSHWGLYLCIVVMLFFYAFNANYYDAVHFSTLFELSLYDPEYQWFDWILLYIAILFYSILLWIIFKTKKKIKPFKPSADITLLTHHDSIPNSSPNIEMIPTASNKIELQDIEMCHDDDSEPIEDIDSDDDQDKEIKLNDGKTEKYAWWKLTMYGVLWILGIFLILVYIASKSLPSKNIIGLNEIFAKCLTYFIALVLIANNKWIIPGFVVQLSRFSWISRYRLQFILALQLINSTVLPLISSVFLLDSCGKYWTRLWDYCNDESLMATFNLIHFNLLLNKWDYIMTVDDVCSTPTIYDMDFNRCIRSFLFTWTGVITLKIVYGIFLQFLSLIYGIIKFKYKGNHTVNMDKKSVSIISNLITSITWSYFAPIILPLTLLDQSIRFSLNYVTYYKLKWTFITKNVPTELLSFPVNFLFIGVGLSQFMGVLFFIYSVENMVISIIFPLFIVVADAVSFYINTYRFKK